jgi:uncharacterized Zn finger protein
MAGRYYEYYPPSRPREAKGGIKAQSKRGDFGEKWWARRWVEVLESFNLGARLSRGRSYARRGQVLSITITKGQVKATVQGSRREPYRVTIKIKSLSNPAWKKVAAAASGQAIFGAKLMAGEMPPEMEELFRESGQSLFPKRYEDLQTECSCPDWSNPCKHILAVYYLLGEEFDRDPFLIFKLRGIERSAFLKLVSPSGEKGAGGRKPSLPSVEEPTLTPGPPEPLAADATRFWVGARLTEDLFGEVLVPAVPASLPKSLGNFPYWRGERHFFEAIEEIYAHASGSGMEAFLGEAHGEDAGRVSS